MIPWHDTLVAHHSYASHFPQRLDHVVSEYCDAGPWKVKYGRRGKTEKGELPKDMAGDDLCKYNAADCVLTALAWERMQDDLAKERGVYEADMKLAGMCRGMTMRGIGIDVTQKEALSLLLKRRQAGIKGEMRRLLKWGDFAPSKLDDVRRALFKRCRAPFTIFTATGLPSTSDAALESLQGEDTKAGQFARLLLTWRIVVKIRSTYVDAVEVLAGRVHYAWKSFGTVSGRFASRLQSCPRYVAPDKKGNPEDQVRSLYVPAPGNQFLYFDLPQAEMRVAAYLSSDTEFIRACEENGGDIHSNNAAIVFPEQARKGWFQGDAKKDPLRGKKFRDIIKNFGFAISYCAEPDKLFITLRRKGFAISYSDVCVALARLRAKYKIYFRWVDKNLADVRRDGYMRTPILGRIRWLGWYPKITDVANFPIQSAVADLMNDFLLSLGAPELVAQVHDAGTFDAPAKRCDVLETAINNYWGRGVNFPGGKMILMPECKRGQRWSDFG